MICPESDNRKTISKDSADCNQNESIILPTYIRILRIIVPFMILLLLVVNLFTNFEIINQFVVNKNSDDPLANEGSGLLGFFILIINIPAVLIILMLSLAGLSVRFNKKRTAIYIIVMIKLAIVLIVETFCFSALLMNCNKNSPKEWIWIIAAVFFVLYIFFAAFELGLAKKYNKIVYTSQNQKE